MSIYQSQAPLWIAATDDLYPAPVEIMVQVVPAWIGHPDYHGYYPTDPYAADLPPPPADPQGDIPRAVVFVFPGAPKVGQIYERPLLLLSGAEWRSLPFPDVWQRLEDAVRERIAEDACLSCGREYAREGDGRE